MAFTWSAERRSSPASYRVPREPFSALTDADQASCPGRAYGAGSGPPAPRGSAPTASRRLARARLGDEEILRAVYLDLGGRDLPLIEHPRYLEALHARPPRPDREESARR